MMILVEVDDPSQVGRNEKRRMQCHRVEMSTTVSLPTFEREFSCKVVDVHPATFENRTLKGLNRKAKEMVFQPSN